MTQSVTSFEAFGIEIDEPLTKRFRQVVKLIVAGANTDVTYDLGTNTGTFWTAAGGSVPGAAALACLKNVQTIASTFLGVRGPQLEAKAKRGSTGVTVLTGTIAGGSATPSATVTGLLTTDTIVAVTMLAKNANSLPLLGWSTQAAGSLTSIYSADPGGSGTILVAIIRSTGTVTPVAGEYTEAVSNLRPQLVFATTDAPTAMTLWMEWDLADGQRPVKTSG